MVTRLKLSNNNNSVSCTATKGRDFFFSVRFPIIKAISLLPHVVGLWPIICIQFLSVHTSHTPCMHSCRSRCTCSSLLFSPSLTLEASSSIAVHPELRSIQGPCPSRHAPRFCLLCIALLVRAGLLIRSAEFALVHRMRRRQLFPRISRTHGCRCPWPWPGSLLCTLLGWGVSWWGKAQKAFRVRVHYRWRWNLDACLKVFDSGDSNRLK